MISRGPGSSLTDSHLKAAPGTTMKQSFENHIMKNYIDRSSFKDPLIKNDSFKGKLAISSQKLLMMQ